MQAVANSLTLDDIPEGLKELSTLESTLISKILALPRGKQKAVHGCVVNVPVNPEETCSILPRLLSKLSIHHRNQCSFSCKVRLLSKLMGKLTTCSKNSAFLYISINITN